MIIYSFLVLIVSFFGYILNKTRLRNNRRICYFLIFLCMFLIGGLRYDVGVDYLGTYVNVYYKMLLGYVDPRFDILPTLIMKFLTKFELHYQWFFLITEFIIVYFAIRAIREQVEDIQLGLFIFICGTLYFTSFNIVRQSVAMILFYYSIKYLKTNNMWKYMVINLIGVTFHSSAIIFIPLYFILKREFKLKTKIIFFASFFIFSAFIISKIITILGFTKYGKYINEADVYTSFESLNLSAVLNILFWICYEISFILKKEKNKKDIIYSNIHFCGVIATILGFFLPLGIRLFSYFRFIEFLSVPNLIQKTNKRYRGLTRIMVFVFYLLYFVLMIGFNGEQYLPYKTIFN